MTLISAHRAIWIALLAAESVVLVWLLATEDLNQLGFLILILGLMVGVVALVFRDWPIGCVMLLALGAAMPRFNILLGGLHLRPEHIATSVAVAAISVQLLRGHVASNLRLRSFDYWLLAYVALNFFSSVVTSPIPRMTIRWAFLNALVVTPYFLVRILVRNDRQVWMVLQGLLWLGMGEALYGTLASVSNHLWDTSWGVELGQYGTVPGTYGTQYEANLFGSYAACTGVMFFTLFLLSKAANRSWYGWGAILCLVGAFFSLARAVLLALPIPIIVLVWISVRRGQFQLRRLLPLMIGIGLVGTALSPFVVDYLSQRFSTLDASQVPTDYSTLGRLVQADFALEEFKANPIFGTGTSSFQVTFNLADLGIPLDPNDEGAGWISNSPLRVLHDTGLVGLMVYLMLLGTLARAAYKALRAGTHSTKVAIVALSAGLLLYAITFQVTEATLLTFSWIHLGLLAAAASAALERGNLREGISA